MTRALRVRTVVLSAVAVLTALVAIGVPLRWHWWRVRPFPQSHNLERRDDWQPFGGAWQFVDGAMLNNSDERGAKLMNGDTHLTDYMIEADVQLSGQYGDAGLIIRANNEEEGVDAYDGYYAGLRDLDNTLILGHAGFGWIEYQKNRVVPRVVAQQWYRLRVLAYDCNIAASATSLSGEVTTDAVRLPDCIRSGRFGLKSYQTGGLWRNVRVRAATREDLLSMVGSAEISLANPLTKVGPIGDPANDANEQYFEPLYLDMREHRVDPGGVPISNLVALAPDKPTPVTIHGVVTLTVPTLFVQDSSGGVEIRSFHAKTPPRIGDQVEAKGEAEPHEFSAIVKNAEVHSLWSHAPLHPMTITASQAATGALDGQYIEIEGHLQRKEEIANGAMILDLDEDNQSFQVITNARSGVGPLREIKEESRLRLRGICVVGSEFTHDLTPFAVLLPSVNDVEVLQGPPWWNTRNIVVAIIACLLIILIAQALQNYIERSRFAAVLDERHRLSQEMHDTLAQSFAGIGFQLQAIRDEIDNKTAIRQEIEMASTLVRRSHEEAKRNIAALRPELLESVGLLKALEESARSMVAGGTIQVIATSSGEPCRIPIRISDTLFRIGQEALANAVRHSSPKALKVSLAYGTNSLKLTVEDNGKGFLVDSQCLGFGIRGMRNRADNVFADLEIRSILGVGTTVVANAPMPRKLSRTRWPMSMWYSIWEQRFHEQGNRKEANPAADRG
jgi:signal transduction histidine kinase